MQADHGMHCFQRQTHLPLVGYRLKTSGLQPKEMQNHKSFQTKSAQSQDFMLSARFVLLFVDGRDSSANFQIRKQ